jgi:excisionase family DNA binding protein
MIERQTANQFDLPPVARLLNVAVVASVLGVSPKTVHKLVREGKLACVQITSRERRFTEDQVQEYIRSRTMPTRVDKSHHRRLSSPPRKGGEKREQGTNTEVSKACLLKDLREEMRQW